MNLDDILQSKAQSPSKKASKEQKGDVESFKGFFAFLHEANVRTTYAGCHAVAYKCKMLPLSEVGKPSGHRVINCLPSEQQYLVARKDGTYSNKATAKWGEEAPEGYEDFKLLDEESVEEVFEAWQAKQD